MGLLSAGALAGMGGAMQNVGAKNIENDFQRERDAMLEQKAMRLAEHGENLRREGAMYDVKNVDPLKSELRVKEAGDVAQRNIDVQLANADKIADSKIAELKKLAPVQAKLAADAELTRLTTLSTPEALAAASKIAQASRVIRPGEQEEAELKKIALQNARLLNGMQESYAAAVQSGDTAKADGLANVMIARFTDPTSKKDSAVITAALKVYADPMADETSKTQAGQVLAKAFQKELGGGAAAKPAPGDRPPLSSFGSNKPADAPKPAPQSAPAAENPGVTAAPEAGSSAPSEYIRRALERRANAAATSTGMIASRRIREEEEAEKERAKTKSAVEKFRERNKQLQY